MSSIPSAFPFIEVFIDTSGLTPIAQRSPGVVAVVGESGSGPGKENNPYEITDSAQVTQLFGETTPLSDSLRLALLQDPRPSKIYGVKTTAGDHAPGLASLEAIEDVTFVSLANRVDQTELTKLKKHVEAASADGHKRIGVAMVNPGLAKPADGTYVDKAKNSVSPLKSDFSRMIMIAARGAERTDAQFVWLTGKRDADSGAYNAFLLQGALTGELPATAETAEVKAEGLDAVGLQTGVPVVVEFEDERSAAPPVHNKVKGTIHSAVALSRSSTLDGRKVPTYVVPKVDTADVATAAMAAIAGFAPQTSTVLKKIRGMRIPTFQQYTPSEINGLSAENIIPVIDPTLIVGESLHFAEGRAFTNDASLLYIDIVRVLDDIEFRLKAGLIGMIGDARITKAGMTQVKSRVEGILGPLQRSAVIDGFTVDIPVLEVLSLPESARNATDNMIVFTARSTRVVDMLISITYGPAVHRLKVTLAPKF